MTRILFISLLLFSCKSPNNNSSSRLKDPEPKNESSVPKQKITIYKPITVKVMTSEIMESDTVQTRIKDRHYTLYPDGKITVRLTPKHQTDTFHLNTELTIETAFFFDHKDDLIIYYTDTDYESGASYIECYDRKTNKIKWKNDIYGFNLTTPIIIDNYTYVASIGFIGKLNLDSGKYLWKHTGLYEKTRFDSFGSIEIKEGKVSFIEGLWIKDTRKPGLIIVNDQTGEIEKIIKNAP